MTDIYEEYKKLVKSIPLLEPSQQYELACKMIAGDKEEAEEAKDKLLYHNLRLAWKMAVDVFSKVQRHQRMDLVNAANLGLTNAINSYNPEKGAFTTYAYPSIKQELEEQLKLIHTTLYMPIDKWKKFNVYNGIKENRENLRLPELNDQEMMKEICVSKEILDTFKGDRLSRGLSFDEVLEGNDDSLENIIANDTDICHDIISSYHVRNILHTIKKIVEPHYYYCFYHHFLLEKRYEVIAQEFNGIERQAIEQKANRTRKRIQEYIKNNGIKDCSPSLSVVPPNPRNITLYLYLKNLNLNGDDVKMLREYLIPTYDCSPKEYANYFNLPFSLYQSKLAYFKELCSTLSKDPLYQAFHNQLIDEYKTEIIGINVDYDFDIDLMNQLLEQYAPLNITTLTEKYKVRDDQKRILKVVLAEAFLPLTLHSTLEERNGIKWKKLNQACNILLLDLKPIQKNKKEKKLK